MGSGDPLWRRIARLTERIDSLREGQLEPPSLVEGLIEWVRADGTLGDLSGLTELSDGLDRIGVHTAAEARLLRQSPQVPLRMRAITIGLERRCARACGALERAVRRAGSLQRSGAGLPGAARQLDEALRKLVRVARVATALVPPGTGDGASLPALMPPGTGDGASLSALMPPETGDGASLPATVLLDTESGVSPLALGTPEARDGESLPALEPPHAESGEWMAVLVPPELGARKVLPAPGARAVAGRSKTPAPPRIELAQLFEARAGEALFDQARRQRALRVAQGLLQALEPGTERANVLALRWRVSQQLEERPGREELDLCAPGPRALLNQVRWLSSHAPVAAWRRLHRLHSQAVRGERFGLAAATQAALEALVPDEEVLGRRLAEHLTQLDAPVGATHPEAELRTLVQELPTDRACLLDLARGWAQAFEVDEGASASDGHTRPASLSRDVTATWPGGRLELGTTGRPELAHDFVMGDPRLVLHDLASRRQPVRTWRDEAAAHAPHSLHATRRSGVRVYVCDASGSMHGARARLRDAVLMAALESLLARCRVGAEIEPIYTCYFNALASEPQRIDDAAGAMRHLALLLGASPAAGATRLTPALTAAFEAIAHARGRDRGLSRASVVLVTDGEGDLDPAQFEHRLRSLEGLDVSLSLVCLGRESPELERLARAQRARGGHARYLHLDDADLQWAHTALETPFRTLLPEALEPDALAIDHAALERRLEALERLACAEDARIQALRPLPASAGAFERLFPDPPPPPAVEVAEPSIQLALQLLEALEATVCLVPTQERASECVQLIEHLCGVYALTPSDWLAALGAAGQRSRPSLRRLRLLAHPLGG